MTLFLVLVVAAAATISSAEDHQDVMIRVCGAHVATALHEACIKKNGTYLLGHDDKQDQKQKHGDRHHHGLIDHDKSHNHDHRHDHDNKDNHNHDHKDSHEHEDSHEHDHDDSHEHDHTEKHEHKDSGSQESNNDAIFKKCCEKPCKVKEFIAFCNN